jgi:CubicO group peptidase (beta-lactamase class C family)
MTSALIGALLRDTLLDSVGQRLVEIMPDLMGEASDPRKADITLEHLLTMTAGFPGDDDAPLSGGEYDHLQATFDLDLVADPGTQWVYSSLGVHLLSGVISARSDLDALTWGQYGLGNTLGITFYGWDRDAAGYPFGGTGLHLMPRDMARFGFLYLREGRVGGRQLLPAEWVRTSIATHVGGDWQWAGIDDLGYGYLWWNGTIGSQPGFFAWGYAGQHIFVFPAVEMIVTTTASFPADPEIGDAQSQAIISLVRDAVLPALSSSATGSDAPRPGRGIP